MPAEDPYRRAARREINIKATPALWERVGALVTDLAATGVRATRGELTEALWHYYTPQDSVSAAELVRAFRLAALRQPLSAAPHQIHLRTIAPFWDRLGDLADLLLAEQDIRSSRSELTQALWWRHLPRDARRAHTLLRAYRAARLGHDPGAPASGSRA